MRRNAPARPPQASPSIAEDDRHRRRRRSAPRTSAVPPPRPADAPAFADIPDAADAACLAVAGAATAAPPAAVMRGRPAGRMPKPGFLDGISRRQARAPSDDRRGAAAELASPVLHVELGVEVSRAGRTAGGRACRSRQRIILIFDACLTRATRTGIAARSASPRARRTRGDPPPRCCCLRANSLAGRTPTPLHHGNERIRAIRLKTLHSSATPTTSWTTIELA